jgi:hypothetical protein
MVRFLKKIHFFIIFFCLLTFTVYTQHNQTEHVDSVYTAFDLIKSLEGNWHGTYKWIGRQYEGEIDAQYYVTGNGSAVVENLLSNGIPSMTSVDHRDGKYLRVTHFCAAGNQPRLKAYGWNINSPSIIFNFIDITNLSSPESGYVKKIELTILNKETLSLIFTFTSAGKEVYEYIKLIRDN